MSMESGSKSYKNRHRKSKGNIREEVYTDKDRAAAVNLGTRDIKHSLKLKKQQALDDFYIIPECKSNVLLALCNREIAIGDANVALNCINKVEGQH